MNLKSFWIKLGDDFLFTYFLINLTRSFACTVKARAQETLNTPHLVKEGTHLVYNSGNRRLFGIKSCP